MISRKFVSMLALAMLIAATGQAQTVDQIIAKNFEAKGGLDKLRAVESMKLTGSMTMGPMEAPFTLLSKRPSMLRIDFTIQGMTGTQGFDGTTAWSLMPFMGKTDPEIMPEAMAKDFRQQADFDGPLVDWKDKGHQVELVGEEELEGTPVYKLKLTLKEGDETMLYLDKDSYLEIKSTSKRTVNDQELQFETSLGDYKEVGGILVPHSIESGAAGTPMRQVISIESVELNPSIDGASFSMPELTRDKPAAEAD
ncbi:MAG TPA: hypothetical protein VM534_00010 [Thermoanaerobaculia bacterium]|nr:hypothetical protein [Thermoanaerobaculia bacterium]